MSSPVVRAARSSAMLTPLLWTVIAPATAAAMTPEGWEEAEPMSTLTALLLFAGVPLALFVLIIALTVAPSVARGNSPSVDRWSTPHWFNGPPGDRALPAAPAMAGAERKALTSSSTRSLPSDGTGTGDGRGYTASGTTSGGLTASSQAGGTATPGAGVPAEQDVLAAAASPGGGASARW